ncbi:MAG: DUF2786 domain-containing protein [Kofleriaceae bacterium]
MQQELFPFLSSAPAPAVTPRVAPGDAAPPPGRPTASPAAEAEPSAPAPEPPRLTAALEAALLREVAAAFDWENQARFRSRLRRPVLTLADTATRLGAWHRATRTLELSLPLVVTRPWPEVLSVLLHEMAHQFVDEVLAVHHEAPHGPTYQAVCAERGIDARAQGAPVPAAAPDPDGGRVLERLRKLLALAASENQHEAELAMRKAHELMLRHNIDAAARPGAYQVRHVGEPTKRLSRVDSMIAVILTEFFFVKVLQIPVYLPLEARRGQLFELTGTAANLDMAEHVYDFLRATAERLWQANRRDQRIRSGHDRLNYQAGVIQGFHDKLAAERHQLRGTGLIWVGDADLDDYYHRRNPRIVRKRRSFRADGAHAAGREAGRKIVLHKPVTSGPSRSGGPKLLG